MTGWGAWRRSRRPSGGTARIARSRELELDDAVADATPDLGHQLPVVGHGPQLHRERRAARRGNADNDPRGTRSRAQDRLDRLHRGQETLRAGVAGEPYVQHGTGTRLDRA